MNKATPKNVKLHPLPQVKYKKSRTHCQKSAMNIDCQHIYVYEKF